MLLDLLNNEIDEKEYLIMNNSKVVYKKLPYGIRGFIYRYRGLNIIVINWNISKEKKKITLLHEFAHLELQHLDKDLFAFSIEGIEDEADRYIKFLLENKN